MKIVLYKYNKKQNSTGLPYSSVPKKEVTVEIYGDISVIAPSFVLTGATGSSPFVNYIGYTYCHVPSFNRYYFINNISIVNGQIVISCNVDLLGTYKYSITSGTAYIKRANTTDAIEKDNLHCTGHITTITEEGATGIFGTMSQYYLVGIRGEVNYTSSNCSLGNCVYYIMNGSQLTSVSHTLWSNSITESSGVNKGDYIISVRPFMAILNDLPVGTNGAVKIGNVTVSDLNATPIDFSNANCYSETTLLGIPIPKHPMSTDTNYHWLNDSPYTSYTVNFGIFGTMNIPCSLLKDRANLTYKVRTYPMSGDITLFVYDSNGKPVIRQTINAMPTIAMSSQTNNLANAVANTVFGEDGVVTNTVMSANWWANTMDSFSNTGVGKFLNNTGIFNSSSVANDIRDIKNWDTKNGNQIGNTINAVKNNAVSSGIDIGGFTIGGVPSISSTGGGGGCYGRHDKPSITGFFADVRDVVPSTEGRAVNKTDTIGNYTGMVQMCLPSVIPTGATDTEKTQLYGILNGVIYIE